MFSTKTPLLAFHTKIMEILLGRISILVTIIRPWILISPLTERLGEMRHRSVLYTSF